MKILVTGVAGFIGSNLAYCLLQQDYDYKVVGLDNLSYGLKENIPDGVEFYPLDDNVHDIVYSKNGHDIVNSKLAMYLEIPRPALIATPLMLVLFNLDHIQNGFCH